MRAILNGGPGHDPRLAQLAEGEAGWGDGCGATAGHAPLVAPVFAGHSNGKIHVSMESGLEVAFPVRGNPRLEGKPHAQLNHIELSPFGLHWPDLDEDLSIRGILAGNYGQRPRQAA